MDLSSFVTSLVTSFVVFLVLMLLFTWLSRMKRNEVIYYPNRILKGLDPYESKGHRTRNPFAWIREALSSTEADVINLSNVDSAVYFVFLSTALGILIIAGIGLLPVLLPVASTDPGPRKENITNPFNELEKLSMGHVTDKSSRLWAFLIATYWVSIAVYCLLWKAYKHVSEIRAAALMAPEVRAEQFAVLVRDIPSPEKGQTVKEQVDSFFKAIYPETFYRSLIVTNNKKANKLHEELGGYKKKLDRAETIHAANPEGKRPTNKTGFLGLIGKEVDSIEYYKEKINEVIPKLEAEQKVAVRENQQSSAIIFFTNRVTAASASQSIHSPMVDTWTVLDAPEPRQLIWTNLSKGFYQREVRQYVIYFIVFLTIFFYMIPIGFVSALTTLANLRKILPFLKPIVERSAIRTVLEAFLPQLALILFLALLPKFLLILSKAEGIPSESHVYRAASGKYFYFSVLNVFIGVTLGGTLFEEFKQIQKKPNSIVDVLARSLPGNATFFITYVALHCFIGYGLQLSRIVPLIIYHLKKKYLCKTEAEVKEAWAPGDIGYRTTVPKDMLILTIVLCYSVIAPIIIPFGALYFSLGWLVQRNQVLKVFVPSYDSYGRWWPHIHTRIIASLILYQVTMFGFFGTKKFFYAALLIPLPIMSLIFAFVCRKKFYPFFPVVALEVACRELKEVPNMEAVFRSYIPPCLSAEKCNDDEYEGGALSQLHHQYEGVSKTDSSVVV